jgi:siroheme synthase-like protein
MMTVFYPIFLNIEGKKCVVVGGGEVAERKVNALLECGASTIVISLHISEGLRQLAEKDVIQVFLRDYQYGDLEGARIAIAATDDPVVNAKVAQEGQERGVLINVVDHPQYSEFFVPSLLRQGDVSIAISTGGKSPALSRKIRTELEQSFTPEYASLALLLSDVRHNLRKRGAQIRSDTWQECLDLDLLLRMLREGEFEEAKERLISTLLEKQKPKSS